MPLIPPDNQIILNQKLYSLLSYVKLNESQLIQARKLLEQGADPNFRPERYAETLVGIATFNRDFKFLKLLIEFSADVDANLVDKIYVKYYMKTNPDKLNNHLNTVNYKIGKLPVQLAIENLLTNYFDQEVHATCELLMKKSTISVNNTREIIAKTEEMYHKLHATVQHELNKAKAEGKRLMILVGEAHESVNSILIESILAYILSAHNHTITLLAEYNNIIHDHLMQTGKILTRGNTWGTAISMFHLINDNLHGTIIPIDQGHFGPSQESKFFARDFDPKSESGIKYRNSIMCTESIQRTSGNVLAIVGAKHLYGLMNETSLKEHFNLVPINVTGYDNPSDINCRNQYEALCTNYLIAIDVLQASIISPLIKPITTPDQLVKIAYETHQKLSKDTPSVGLQSRSHTPLLQ